MLTKDLLRYRIDAGQIHPAFLNPGSPRYAQAAQELIVIFGNHLNIQTRQNYGALFLSAPPMPGR